MCAILRKSKDLNVNKVNKQIYFKNRIANAIFQKEEKPALL